MSVPDHHHVDHGRAGGEGLPRLAGMPDHPAIGRLLRDGERSFSFEFFPPADADGEEVLWRSIRELEPLRPTFVSVTYGAGGGTRDRTVGITERIARETSMLPMAHLTCVGHTKDELGAIIEDLREAGVHNVLALRGDPPGGPGDAVDLDARRPRVRLRAGGVPPGTSTGCRSGVAAFPEGHRDAPRLEHDAEVLKAKYDAGAEFAITEMVLRASDYFGLVRRARAIGADFPIVPGIMPILNLNSMRTMVRLSGREMPPEILDRILPLQDDPAELRAEGIADRDRAAARSCSPAAHRGCTSTR